MEPGEVLDIDSPQIMPSVPAAVRGNSFPTAFQHSPTPSSSGSESDSDLSKRLDRAERVSRSSRPKVGNRKPSGSIIIPKNNAGIEVRDEEFPPDDARAMSPRRNSADVERLGEEARQALRGRARSLQSSLQALVEKVETVKQNYSEMENENKLLQNYIGDLTRRLSKSDLSSSLGGKSKK